MFLKAIHKAGKHMENHLIASYCALLIGDMLMNQNDQRMLDVHEIKLKLKDSSFKYMAQIIRKFLVFMKIMVINFVWIEKPSY